MSAFLDMDLAPKRGQVPEGFVSSADTVDRQPGFQYTLYSYEADSKDVHHIDTAKDVARELCSTGTGSGLERALRSMFVMVLITYGKIGDKREDQKVVGVAVFSLFKNAPKDAPAEVKAKLTDRDGYFSYMCMSALDSLPSFADDVKQKTELLRLLSDEEHFVDISKNEELRGLLNATGYTPVGKGKTKDDATWFTKFTTP